MGAVRKAIVTCDECQASQDAAMGDAAFGVLPPGWVTVSGRVLYPGPNKDAELCSWACAAAFTTRQAGESQP